MNSEAVEEKESPDEDNCNEDRDLGDRQRPFSVGGELKNNATDQVEEAGAGSRVLGPSSVQVLQQQPPPQGAVVCWERFLPVRTIRVLLVENDDCTRHVVCALLRNCHYEVLEAANGIQAWRILEDLANHIDLVLTEVVMPCLPGIPLLSKIMSHKTRKNIPVIMMSSHDSMSLVFKCLSKGAVDFLVKPIRKNELKNLWQHVWRRCHSSSGSGSESGTQTQKSVKSKSSEKSDNSGSDDGENDLSNGLNVGDGSDDGSGAQSSWTKQPAEVDSSRSLSLMDQVAERPDSTCAQVIRSNAENLGNKGVSISVARGNQKQKQDEDTNLETLKPRNVELRTEKHVEIPLARTSPKLGSLSESNYNTIINQIDIGQPNPISEGQLSKHKVEVDEVSNPLIDGRESESTKEGANILDNNNNATDDSKEPTVGLSLKRLRGVQDTGRSVQDDRYVLRRSEQSAFSRYNTASNAFKAPNGITGSSSVIDNSTEVVKRESAGDIQVHSGDHLVYRSPNGVSNNLDMGSTTNKLSKQPLFMKDKSETTSTVNGLHHSSFRPVKTDLRCSGPQASRPLYSDVQTTDLGRMGDLHQELPVQHSHHDTYNHHHRHHFHNLEQEPPSNHEDLSLKKLAADAPHRGSTNAVGGTMDSNPRNYSLNRSASGSNYGSNGQNGSSTAINAAGTNAESDVGRAGKSGSGDASGSGSGSGNRVDEEKLAHRVAALSKFRQKKKDRCFTKKVRYHNRKKLAEQRPRVRGQFVKQTGTDSSNKSADE